jgi:hypothetical protein
LSVNEPILLLRRRKCKGIFLVGYISVAGTLNPAFRFDSRPVTPHSRPIAQLMIRQCGPVVESFQ